MYSLSVDEIINKKDQDWQERRELCSPSCFSGRFPGKGFINQVWDVQGIILKNLNNMYDKFWLINIFFLSHIFDFTFYLLKHCQHRYGSYILSLIYFFGISWVYFSSRLFQLIHAHSTLFHHVFYNAIMWIKFGERFVYENLVELGLIMKGFCVYFCHVAVSPMCETAL